MIDDEPLTVSKLGCGLALLAIGFFASRILAGWVARSLLPKMGIGLAAANALQMVIFYTLLALVSLASLDLVNVPLTVFAFMGGAIAIGVGFGSQNLVNNFMSGLILLVERPIRVGDLVNVDGIDANVEHIGTRSTRVKTRENLEILIPNSKFLENSVTNWTLSDTRVQTSVSVGVAYGSPVQEVIAVLQAVVRDHPGVHQSPKPVVLFEDFADSALTFEVHFWIEQKCIMDGDILRSEVRASIDAAFRRSKICIAFPQRDVHIDMHKPLEIRLANSPAAARIAVSYSPGGIALRKGTQPFSSRAGLVAAGEPAG